jgi:hypothetical protein
VNFVCDLINYFIEKFVVIDTENLKHWKIEGLLDVVGMMAMFIWDLDDKFSIQQLIK